MDGLRIAPQAHLLLVQWRSGSLAEGPKLGGLPARPCKKPPGTEVERFKVEELRVHRFRRPSTPGKFAAAARWDSKIALGATDAPGEDAPVDDREGAFTRDPKAGPFRRPRLFVMTLR
jgi:hypothetical protein